MKDQRAKRKKSAKRAARVGDHRGRGSNSGESRGKEGREHDRDDHRLTANEKLTKRIKALDEALHGSRRGRPRQALNWNEVDETAVTFESIEDLLELPPERLLEDEKSDASQSGG
ncbi:hypothetical protein [Streptomyces umbrinus]|uniref:hypothetical protein n=1 Tax=Streptomyces umbrinus TaxID=67370 RepID=UPI0034073713